MASSHRRSGTGVLKMDGREVATEKMAHTLPLILQWDENLDVGSDTRRLWATWTTTYHSP